MLYDVLDLLLQAQQDGRSVNDVVGDDVEAFMERVQSSFGYRNRLLYHVLNGLQYSVCYLLLMQTVLFLEEAGRISFFTVQPDISMVGLICVISFLAMPLIRYFVRRQSIGMVVLIPIGIGILFIGLTELGRAYLYHIPWVRTFLDGQVALIPSLGVLLLWVGAAAAAQLVKWLKRRASVKRLV